MFRSPLILVLCILPAAASAADPRRLNAEANHLYATGRYAEAQAKYAQAEHALTADPHSLALVRFNRAAALYQQGRYAAAADLYRKAAETAPPNLTAKLSYALGGAHFKLALESQADVPRSIDLIRSSADHYRDCLRLERTAAVKARAPAADSLIADARHNLDLATRFLNRQLERLARPQKQTSDSSAPPPEDRPSRSEPSTDARSLPHDAASEQDRTSPQDALTTDAAPPSAAAGPGDLSHTEAEQRLADALQRIRQAQKLRLHSSGRRVSASPASVKDW